MVVKENFNEVTDSTVLKDVLNNKMSVQDCFKGFEKEDMLMDEEQKLREQGYYGYVSMGSARRLSQIEDVLSIISEANERGMLSKCEKWVQKGSSNIVIQSKSNPEVTSIIIFPSSKATVVHPEVSLMGTEDFEKFSGYYSNNILCLKTNDKAFQKRKNVDDLGQVVLYGNVLAHRVIFTDDNKIDKQVDHITHVPSFNIKGEQIKLVDGKENNRNKVGGTFYNPMLDYRYTRFAAFLHYIFPDIFTKEMLDSYQSDYISRHKEKYYKKERCA